MNKVNIDLRISSVNLQKCHFYFANRLSRFTLPIILYREVLHPFPTMNKL